MEPRKLTSGQNPRVKQVVRLRERRERDKTGLFLIEGYRELSRAVAAGWTIDTLFTCPSFFLGVNEEELIRKIDAPHFVCLEGVFSKLSYRDRPDGLLAIAPQRHLGLDNLRKKKKRAPFYLVAESLEKPGNLGTILRSADAAGVDGVIVCDPTTDLYNPNVVRASVGTLFTVPVFEASSEECLEFFQREKIQTIAASPHAERLFTEIDMTGPIAILVGTEQYGLSPVWMHYADQKAKIPMHGVADSLNVATATTLLLYEVVRQRK